jgi:hypothetical protein
MAKDVTSHDATVDMAESFDARRCSRVVVSIRWDSLAGGGSPVYYLRQSMIDATLYGDDVPSIPSGVALSGASGSATIEVNNPADFFEHVTDSSTLSAGTIDVATKILYTND